MKNISLFIVISLFLWSCDDDFFSQTLDVDPPDFEALMVVNLIVDNLRDSLECRVSETFPVLEEKNPQESLLNDAQVDILSNGTVISSLVPEADRTVEFNFKGAVRDQLNPGETYTLRVTHPDYGVVEGVQVMPEMVKVKELNLVEEGRRDIDGFEYSRLEIEIEDPADIQNFYGMQLVVFDTTFGVTDIIYLEVFDPQIQYGYAYNDLYLSDQAFNGKSYTILLDFEKYRFQDVKQNGFLIWKTVTDDFFLYTTSLARFNEGSDFGAFSEPVLIHSNIEGGLGCFGLVNAQVIPLPR